MHLPVFVRIGKEFFLLILLRVENVRLSGGKKKLKLLAENYSFENIQFVSNFFIEKF